MPVNERDLIRLYAERSVLSIHAGMADLTAALHELARLTSTLFAVTPNDPVRIAAWMDKTGFGLDEDGYFTALPLQKAFRNGSAPPDALAFFWAARQADNPVARFHTYALSRLGSHLKSIHDGLGVADYIYYQDASGPVVTHPYIDPRGIIPPDFDWRGYYPYQTTGPEANPARSVRWALPRNDFGSQGLFTIVSIPLYTKDVFLGLWSIDVPLKRLYSMASLAVPPSPHLEAMIADLDGNLVMHHAEGLAPVVDLERKEIRWTSVSALGGGFRDLNLQALAAEGAGHMRIVDAGGEPLEMFYLSIPEVEWLFVVTYPSRFLFETVSAEVRAAFDHVRSGDLAYRIPGREQEADPALIKEFNRLSAELEANRKRQTEAEQSLRTSEARYRDLVERMSAITFEAVRTPTTERYTYVSPQTEQILGIAPAEFLADPGLFERLIHPDDRESVLAAYSAAIKDALPFEADFRLLTRSGRAVWIHDRVQFRRGPDARETTVRGIAFDITARKEAEEAYRTLVENANQGILVYQDGRVLYANPAFCRMSGYSREDLVGMPGEATLVLTHPDDREAVWSHHQDRLAGRPAPTHYDFRLLRKDGSSLWVEIHVANAIYQGKPAMQSAFLDVTDRKWTLEFIRIQRDLAVALSSSEQLTDTLDHILDAALQLEGVDCGGIYLAEEGSHALILRCHRGLSPAFVRDAARYEPGARQFHLANMGQTLYVNGRDEQRGTDPIITAEDLHAIAVLPVLNDGRVVAVMNLASHTVEDFPPHVRAAAETIAAQIGASLVRVHAVTALRESQHNLQSVFDAVDDLLFVVGADQRILHVNSSVLNRLNYSLQELVGMPVVDLHPAHRRDEALSILREMAAGRATLCEVPLQARDGTLIPVETKVARGVWNGTEVVIGTSRDVSERLETETALRLSEERYRLQYLSNPIATITFQHRGDDFVMVQFNEAMDRLSAGGMSQRPGILLSELLKARPDIAAMFGESYTQRRVSRRTTPYRILATNEVRQLALTSAFVPPDLLIVFAEDVTDQWLLEQERQRFTEQLIEVQESERREISAALHDQMGQLLTLARLDLEGLHPQDSQPHSSIQNALKQIDAALATVRNLAVSLHPPLLDDLGIRDALAALVEEFRAPGKVQAAFHSPRRLPPVAPAARICLYRVVQEALTNVSRHAHATHVHVRLNVGKEALQLEIRDDGVGFAAREAGSRKGIGLLGMRERVRQAGGTLDIESAPGQGTAIRVSVPLDSVQDEGGTHDQPDAR